MISEEMYALLRDIPLFPRRIPIDNLVEHTGYGDALTYRMVDEAEELKYVEFLPYELATGPNSEIHNCVTITERGLEARNAYMEHEREKADRVRKMRIAEESLELQKTAVQISRIALEKQKSSLLKSVYDSVDTRRVMWATVASAVIAFFMLVATILIA